MPFPLVKIFPGKLQAFSGQHENLPFMTVLLVGHLALAKIYEKRHDYDRL